MNKIEEYQALLKELSEIRHRHKFSKSYEEELHMVKMDELWNTLSKVEMETLWAMQRALPL